MKPCIAIACVLLTMASVVNAQLLDTLNYSWQQPRKPFFGLDFSKSFGNNFGADVYGYRGGVVQNKRLYYGLGYYRLNTDKVANLNVTDASGNDTVVPGKLKLRFITLNAEYVFFKTRKFQTSVPLNIGFGHSFFQYFKQRSETEKTAKNNTALCTFGIAANYKLVSWAGIGLGTSFATTLGTNKSNNQNFNALTYSFGLKIFLDDLKTAIKTFKNQQDEKSTNDSPQPDYETK